MVGSTWQRTSLNCIARLRTGTVIFQKRLTRSQFHRFTTAHSSCVVATQAGGAHYWAREMRRLGHDVGLNAPRYVKAFIKRQKNAPADAAAVRCLVSPCRRRSQVSAAACDMRRSVGAARPIDSPM